MSGAGLALGLAFHLTPAELALLAAEEAAALAARSCCVSGGAAADETLVFEWNQADISQFADNKPTSVVYGGGGVVPPTLSVVATSRGPALRISPGDWQSSLAVFSPLPSACPLVWAGPARKLRVELEVGALIDNGGAGYAGIALGDLGPDCWFAHYVFGAAEWGARMTAGVADSSGGTGNAAQGGFVAFEVRGQAGLVGAPPVVSSYASSQYGPTRRSGDANSVGWGNSVRLYGNGNPETADWNGKPLERVGLAIRGGNGGSPFCTLVDVLSWRVFQLGA